MPNKRENLNTKDIEKLQKKLIEKKQDISSELSEIYNESKSVETGIAQDVGDKAESSYTKEFLLSLTETERTQLLMIDDALKRIQRGVYGFCQKCGKRIDLKRLNAVPWTHYCIECQQKEEEES